MENFWIPADVDYWSFPVIAFVTSSCIAENTDAEQSAMQVHTHLSVYVWRGFGSVYWVFE